MKHRFFIILILALVIATPFSVSAETEAGVKPDSFWYSFDLLGEKISLFFTRDPFEKAKKNILFADERIAEIESISDNAEAHLKAAVAYEKNVSNAFALLDKIEEREKKIGFLISFSNRYEKHWGTLMATYDGLPEDRKSELRGTLLTYLDSVDKGATNVQALLDTSTNESGEEPTGDSPELIATRDEIRALQQEIDALKQQKQSPPSVAEIKEQNPQQYESLVKENKNQLSEASKLLSNRNIIARVKPSVVYIETRTSSGSGIVVESNGYVLTNAHVVSGVNSATVKLANGRSYTGTVVGRDENIDLALLKVGTTGLTAAFLGSSDSIEQGDPVFTFGYPLGIEGDVSFKDGTLSRRHTEDGISYLEISAQILPGNSGGPLVNQAGEVIGVNTFARGSGKLGGILIGETLKFALPINVAKNILPELKNGRNVILPKSSTAPSDPTPSPSPSPNQPILPPEIFTPPPEPEPEPVPTTISNVTAKEESYGLVISWDSNKSSSYGGWRALIGKNSDLSDAIELKLTYKSVTYSDVEQNTTYYYQVFVKDGCTQCLSYDPVEAKSEIFSITTNKTDPSIINVDVSYPSSSSVVITVTTDIEGYSELTYKRETEDSLVSCFGTKANDHIKCDSITGATGKKKEHTFTFSSVPEGIIYEYRIEVAPSSYGSHTDFETGTFSAQSN